MPYSTLAHLISSLPEAEIAQLSDDEQGLTVNIDRVNEAIAKADALINGFLPVIPTESTPDVLVQISAQLAIYFLYLRKMGHDMPDSVENDYKRQIDLLKMIQSGKLNIGLSTDDGTSDSGTFHKTNKTSDSRMFGDDMWGRY